MKLRVLVSRVKHILLFLLIQFIPIKKNRVICLNFNGKGFGDSPKYVIEEIEKSSPSFYDFYWATNELHDTEKPMYLKTVKYRSLKFFLVFYTSKLIISNVRLDVFLYKRRNQTYYQTWHGGIALKKIEKDAEKKLDQHYIYQAKKDSKMIDIFVSNSRFNTELIKSSFWYHGEIIETGLPRNSLFFTDTSKIVQKIRLMYAIEDDTLLVLYAPTFRKTGPSPVSKFDYLNTGAALEAKFKKRVKFIVRLHPADSTTIDENDYTLNATNYPDIQELLCSADIFITDYSSTMFEFMYRKLPLFIFSPDVDKYEEERGYYFNLDQLPIRFNISTEALIEDIAKYSENSYVDKIEEFLKSLVIYDNVNSAENVAKHIIKKISV